MALITSGDSAAALPKISAPNDWLRDPQRFPVIIAFDDDSSKGLRREGGQSDVIIYTGDNSYLNLIGRFWIRVVSLFSYIR